MHSHVSDNGVLVASLPNVRYIEVFRPYLINAEWNYKDYGVLDRTHLRFFTRKSMIDLFASTGFELVSIEGINSYPVGWKFNILNFLLGGRLEDMKYQQFALVLKKAGAGPASEIPSV